MNKMVLDSSLFTFWSMHWSMSERFTWTTTWNNGKSLCDGQCRNVLHGPLLGILAQVYVMVNVETFCMDHYIDQGAHPTLLFEMNSFL